MRLNIFIAFLLFLMSFNVMAIEEPEFISVEKKDAFEIREYKPKLVAQVLVSGTFDSASNNPICPLERVIGDGDIFGIVSGTIGP